MPTLSWIGKEKVVTHHQDVPFRVLSHKYGFFNGKTISKVTGTGNKVIHGDNLEALKSLLPEYENKVKCIYIDPPYNTGNEGWVYNDNVNDPKIKKWLNTVVGKEGEDLSRHDKWLCMMYPRLRLLQKLLSDDGSIWVSIDDNAIHLLRSLMDEIFGSSKFIACNVWQKRYSRENRGAIGDAHEYLLVYAKNPEIFKVSRNKIPLGEKQNRMFENPDNDPRGPWQSVSLTAQGFRPNQMYEIESPNGRKHKPPEGRCWSTIESEYQKLNADKRLYFGKDGNGVPRRKNFLKDAEGLIPWTWWPHDEVGHTDESRKEIQSIFGTQTVFDTPKPTRLIERILQIATSSDSIVLDSFSGSGSTAHSVLNLNASDKGKRRFILVEMEDYAETVTAERVRRVINGFADKPGTGGAFDYYELGEPLFLPSGDLNENIPIEEIRSYVFYTETGLPIVRDHKDIEHFCGTANNTAYYFYYDKNAPTCLDRKFLSKIKTKTESYLIYADNCLLTESFMKKKNIIFKKIPRDITRF